MEGNMNHFNCSESVFTNILKCAVWSSLSLLKGVDVY